LTLEEADWLSLEDKISAELTTNCALAKSDIETIGWVKYALSGGGESAVKVLFRNPDILHPAKYTFRPIILHPQNFGK
jgi:hypothetical protein